VTNPVAKQAYSAGADVPVIRTAFAYEQAASVQLVTGIGLITCVNFLESTGNAAGAGYLWDGETGAGQLLACLGVPEGVGQTIAPAGPGIPFSRGIYLQIVNSSLSVVVTYIPFLNPLG